MKLANDGPESKSAHKTVGGGVSIVFFDGAALFINWGIRMIRF
jgi:hypothetical protein